ncbi:MAG: hypothetical protein ABW185_19590 [Sedimenticola sp.]
MGEYLFLPLNSPAASTILSPPVTTPDADDDTSVTSETSEMDWDGDADDPDFDPDMEKADSDIRYYTQVSYCYRFPSVIVVRPHFSNICCIALPMWFKLHRDGLCVTTFQKCENRGRH